MVIRQILFSTFMHKIPQWDFIYYISSHLPLLSSPALYSRYLSPFFQDLLHHFCIYLWFLYVMPARDRLELRIFVCTSPERYAARFKLINTFLSQTPACTCAWLQRHRYLQFWRLTCRWFRLGRILGLKVKITFMQGCPAHLAAVNSAIQRIMPALIDFRAWDK